MRCREEAEEGKRITQYELSHYRRKYEDQILVAACGCFDIFHIGHLEYLSGAKALGDLLLVGVNSDESIKQMKGTYPIFSIQDRMSMVSALSCVDYVFPFHNTTFDQCLWQLQPNIFARGADAEEKGFPEAHTTEKYKIHVIKVGEIKRASSSWLRRRLTNEERLQ